MSENRHNFLLVYPKARYAYLSDISNFKIGTSNNDHETGIHFHPAVRSYAFAMITSDLMHNDAAVVRSHASFRGRMCILEKGLKMQNDDSEPTISAKPRKGIVRVKDKKYNDDLYYPPSCYMEDFEIEEIESLNLLENFKPIDRGI
ncbi:hypothetical protein [Agrobacterium fabrum]|uniref:hypothetical protein n=1 Tax=Agrobacterium fabrum TaxID=1176649 RepID=UPI0024768DF9|nr:hypothetical protein [Agrobacterium fabrum]MDH6298794.1 hypothetical protein [Agrobacterium fabrum]